MKQFQHTFVVLAYRESPYIEACLQSLRAQTIRSELILSTSTPSSFLNALAQKYELPVVVNPNQQGIAADWSFAYRAAQTPYLTLAHQDDLYLPKYTEQCLTAAQRHPDNLMTFTGYREFVGNAFRRFSLLIVVKQMLLGPFFFSNALHSRRLKMACVSCGNPIACPSVMYHKEVIGEFEFSRDWQFNLDWEAWVRLAQRQGCFVRVTAPLMVHRLHEDSETSRLTMNSQRKIEELRMLQRLLKPPWAKIVAKAYSLGSKLNAV